MICSEWMRTAALVPATWHNKLDMHSPDGECIVKRFEDQHPQVISSGGLWQMINSKWLNDSVQPYFIYVVFTRL